MRRILWLLSTLGCVVIFPAKLCADGSQSSGGTIDVGGIAGISAAKFGGENAEGGGFERVWLPRLTAGVSVRLRLHDWFALQPEALWVSKGSGTRINGVRNADFRARYLEMTALARLTAPVEGPVRPYLLAGPTLGVLLDLDVVDLGGAADDRTDLARRLDLGLMAGAGVTWRVDRRWRVSLDARYDWGVRSIDRTDAVDLANRAVFFTLGVGARLGGS